MKRIKFLILAIFFISASHAAYAIEYGGLGISPNNSEVSQKNPLTKAWFIYTLEPGTLKKGKADVTNTSDKAVEARLYPVDAVTTADGAFAPEPEDKQKVGVGSWVSLDKTELYLEPGETKVVDFTIQVPNDVQVGDHMGAIIAQSKESSEEVGGSGLRIATRVGARIYITVPGKIIKELIFEEFTQETKEGVVTFYTAFANNGNVRMRLKGVIEIRDSYDKMAAMADIPEREVFPLKKITIPVEWRPENLAGGKLTARAIVTYDADQLLTKELAFSIPLLKKPFAIAAISFSGIGTGIGIGFVISLFLFGALLLIRKKNRGR